MIHIDLDELRIAKDKVKCMSDDEIREFLQSFWDMDEISRDKQAEFLVSNDLRFMGEQIMAMVMTELKCIGKVRQ